MIVIGLTGSFGTGKTFVASVFKDMGATVLDADKLAHRALNKESASYRKIVALFGSGILGKNSRIDRTKLAAVVFSKKAKLKKLNTVLHPGVIAAIKRRVKEGGEGEIIVIDAPLLLEVGLAGIVDKIIVVTASRSKQIARCAKKFGMKKRDILKRIGSQLPLEKKVALADFVINNDGTRTETRREVKKVWGEIVWR